jgi:hypothetical protein
MQQVQSNVRPLAYQLAVNAMQNGSEGTEPLKAGNATFSLTGSSEMGADVIYDF